MTPPGTKFSWFANGFSTSKPALMEVYDNTASSDELVLK
eukprot:CAMPEP_0201645088 /NCGR_PEP_ID=MMETSP0493-20130528/31402_1 /ASSEMBLY_ACC=CAM_ASM_000838 /TAXON_ID=420259 /ORGANISM="Thalassiosira gravida, Strain GMp14c1" /LENGTH=38 /DNA_ID= /DNA_START= /DNA_END= /DNA_ORIENTATION=